MARRRKTDPVPAAGAPPAANGPEAIPSADLPAALAVASAGAAPSEPASPEIAGPIPPLLLIAAAPHTAAPAAEPSGPAAAVGDGTVADAAAAVPAPPADRNPPQAEEHAPAPGADAVHAEDAGPRVVPIAEPTAEVPGDNGRSVAVFLRSFLHRPERSLPRAAAIALAAALGAVAGAVAAAGLATREETPDPVLALQESVRMLAVEVRALKASVEGADSGGIAALGERLERSEKAQAALTAEIGKLSAANAAGPVSAETTGSIVPQRSAPVDGWVLWRVRDGRALVHGNGTYYEVVPGSRIPGLGIVQRIAREDGRWVVTTQNGQIVAPRT